ncbi:30S ribosomal protein S17 [Thermoproteus tenax]|uniref:Small ribosomal subunit protein uS17 n=1 Tax=Thermoproteus tenax (strain ATCC 35583 / DSM 2078 / JCM 9277 / NBRC 100435 / Kra 1) TaxID=768679 RepID=G4RKR1_THETK|nr:30S ribosomal protein S17 [Thermoproteus tenax]CCC82156.1 30S ribosomal protein S17p [Thermoproteus tenax Kra 1]
MTTIKLPSRPHIGDVVTFPNGTRVRVANIGIPWIQPPSVACDDPECPWHGHLKIRPKTLEVVVESVRMHKAAVVIHEWVHYVPKYKRYERRRRKIHVRVPECIEVKPGDKVIIAETRPLAKTIAWVVIGKSEDVVNWTAKREVLTTA